MKRVVCAVFDTAVETFGQPFFVPHRGAALRSFGDEINRKGDQNNTLGTHPTDFILWEIASFDDETGKFELPEKGPNVIARGADLTTKD